MTKKEAEIVLELYGYYNEDKLKKQYHKLAKKYHPDMQIQQEAAIKNADTQFKKLCEAYENLKNSLEEERTGFYNQSSKYYQNRSLNEVYKLKRELENQLDQESLGIHKLKLNLLNPRMKAHVLDYYKKYIHVVRKLQEILTLPIDDKIYDSQNISSIKIKVTKYKKKLMSQLEVDLWKSYIEEQTLDSTNKKILQEYIQKECMNKKEIMYLYEIIDNFINNLNIADQKRMELLFVKNKEATVIRQVHQIFDEYSHWDDYEVLKEKLQSLENGTIELLKYNFKTENGIMLDMVIQAELKNLPFKILEIFRQYKRFSRDKLVHINNLKEKINKAILSDLDKEYLLSYVGALYNITDEFTFYTMVDKIKLLIVLNTYYDGLIDQTDSILEEDEKIKKAFMKKHKK